MSGLLMKGKVGIVTGAGSPLGIGRSLVIALADAGARAVYACDLNMSNISSLQEEIKKRGHSCRVEGRLLDVSSEERTIEVLKAIVKAEKRFDFFFANAGVTNYRHLNDIQSSQYDRFIAVMQKSVFLALKYGSQAMMVTSDEKPKAGGSIVVTSSIAALLGSFADVAYTSAKAATIGLVRAGSVQLSTSNIRVNGIAPGATATSLLSSSPHAEKGAEYTSAEAAKTRVSVGIDVKAADEESVYSIPSMGDQRYYYNRTADPAELANVGIFLASDLATSINGQVIVADSGKTVAAIGDTVIGTVPPMKPLDLY